MSAEPNAGARTLERVIESVNTSDDEGSVTIGSDSSAKTLGTHAAGVLSTGSRVAIIGGADGARFLLLSARPLNEPIVQHGPFVMNTAEEIRQTIADYQSGSFGG